MSSPFQTGAAQTQLPPSPEFKASELSPSSTFIPNFNLENSNSFLAREEDQIIPPRRLRSVARYRAFHPQALACSNVVTSSYLSDSGRSNIDKYGGKANSPNFSNINDQGPSSLGAVAGPQGVALFRLSKPHVPLMILSHATNASAGLFSSLSFSDQDKNLYLGAARGSGVLVWDASGHSTSPLLGRLGVDSAVTSSSSSDPAARFTSIAWKKGTTSPLLAATTSNTLSIWDIRSAPSGSFKPTLRFGSTAKITSSSSSASATSFVQVACSCDSDECATIDSNGFVRIYDIRMTDRVRTVAGAATSTFPSFDTAGIGISYFGLQQSSGNVTTSWLTWGIDNLTNPVVKIWSSRPSPTSVDEETVTASSGSVGSQSKKSVTVRPTPSSHEYHMLAKCSRPNLSCARVCPAPIENHFLVMGQSSQAQGGWWSELYKLGSSDSQLPSNQGVDKVLGFTGGSSSADNNALGSILGNSVDIGDLQAVELAFSSSRMIDSSNDEQSDVELLVCCLTDSGILTTHAVPEAYSSESSSDSGVIAGLGMSPVKARRPLAAKTGFSFSSQAKVYPDNREGTSLFDAAGFWGGDPLNGRAEEGKSETISSQSLHRKLEPNTPVSQANRGQVGGEGLMPFDMDVPVAYGTVATAETGLQLTGVAEIGAAGNLVSPSGITAVEEAKIAADARDAKAMMENIETERIPCPRLCGAAFCQGSGAMVVFQNGEVKKMWSWFQRSDNARIPGAISAKGEVAFTETESVQTPSTSSMTSPSSPSSTKMKLSLSSSGPRTLKALMNMTEAAKQAQWGEVGSEASDSDDVAADQYFEDDSGDDDSNSSDSGVDIPSTPPRGAAPDVMQAYFVTGSSGKLDSPPSPPTPTPNKLIGTPRKLRFLGPSSDTLTPVVRITHQVESLVLNGQSAELAAGFVLGIGNGYRSSDFQEEKTEQIDVLSNKVPVMGGSGLPNYSRFATPVKSSLARTRSDPNFLKVQLQEFQVDEPGVHGGEYSVRPNMEESMTFLRKLFNHQQGGKNYTTLLSPPDSPFLPGSLQKGSKRLASTGNLYQERDTLQMETKKVMVSEESTGLDFSANEPLPLGVYTLRILPTEESLANISELEEIKQTCLHNATVCESLGQTDKEGVWNLLAETVENQMVDNGKYFNGWGGSGGGALGVDLVSNLLTYYESLGDVQMLATIVCVLSGRGRNSYSLSGRTNLLPVDSEEIFDSYIQRYAELLYAWNLLSLRAELNKYLRRPQEETEIDATVEGGDGSRDRTPGISVVIACPKCGSEVNQETNFCHKCQDFAFRCSLCDNAVRGLFVVCDYCQHGGHVEHISRWFAKQEVCPTGCGCLCSFTPATVQTPKHQMI